MKFIQLILAVFTFSILTGSSTSAQNININPSTAVDASIALGEKINQKRKIYLESHMNTMRALVNSVELMTSTGEAGACEISSFVVGLADNIPSYVVTMPNDYMSLLEFSTLPTEVRAQIKGSENPPVILNNLEANELTEMIRRTRAIIDSSLQILEDPANGCFDGPTTAEKPSNKKECCKLRPNRPVLCLEVDHRAKCKPTGLDNENCSSTSTLCTDDAGSAGLRPLED